MTLLATMKNNPRVSMYFGKMSSLVNLRDKIVTLELVELGWSLLPNNPLVC